ncbi:NSFL1 cofactor p47 isoform X3 [Diachasma alloeum]|uniref:NSFL1 cofactor p47 isoform X3 n=1 Tax=Diachasma alloeum TaxID=454923 RepID=UPI0007381033|nr:NSFL1 cofactor p47 isoform X3 [Diachasma alloeum]
MDDVISQFMDITGVERERASFYLASSAWQLEVALGNFYEYGESGAPEGAPEIIPVDVATDRSSPEEISQPEVTESMNMDPSKQKPKSKPKSTSRFATLSSFQNQESSSDEEGQAFYAGGSATSGQQILGPNKKKADIINDMFKTCQKQSVPGEEKPQSHCSHQQRPNTFSGTGYKLGQTSSDTEVIPASPSSQPSNTGMITLKLWRDGFTINDREIRSYTDPQNREFLDAIKRGEIPAEIREEVQGVEARLDMEDHRHEEYVPSKPKVKAFAGKGHKLGSPSPATVGMTVPADPADQAANESQARSQLNLDTNSPTTTIQIRLADGQNIREQFNLTHTVGDIRRYITTMRPHYAIQDFSLLTAYPTKELTEEDKTIEEAGLKNSALMQRLK